MNLELKIPPPLVMLLFGVMMFAFANLISIAPITRPTVMVALIACCALSVMLSGVWSFRRAKTTVNPLQPQEASSLVVSGVFRYTRNPMYLGMAMLLTAWSLWLGELSALAFVLLFMLYLQIFQIKPEERLLSELFGEPYRHYLQEARRWL